MNRLENHCQLINRLFDDLMSTNSHNEKEFILEDFKDTLEQVNVNVVDILNDLDFCFEVLAGKHKLGYTFVAGVEYAPEFEVLECSIKELVEYLKTFSSSSYGIDRAGEAVPYNCLDFIERLVNRKFKLGYSNKKAMVTDMTPMLAKKYPDDFREQFYYIQEKLDGHRTIAYFLEAGMLGPFGIVRTDGWFFMSRSGKPQNLDFDMSWADTSLIYDGETMTLKQAGTRDFNRTSGAINSKYGDKSNLHYFIYDIIDDTLTYKERKNILDDISDTGKDCSILLVLDYIWLNRNVDYNGLLDKILDQIVSKGGEGLILRDPDATYQHKRTDALLKYKKTQTMDLRIKGWNYGKKDGKYENAIGSFICVSDCGKINVNVSGMSDDIRFSDPFDWLDKIIEVAYFDTSIAKNKTITSLRFPRMKRVREDKDTTSIF